METFDVEFKEGYPQNVEEKTVTIKENKTTVITPTTGYIGINKLNVITEVTPTSSQEKTINIIKNNETKEVTPDLPTYDSLSKVNINTSIPLENKIVTVTENGKQYEFTPSENYEGIKNIKVDVQTPTITLEEKTITFNENHKTYTLTPSATGKAFSKVIANIEVDGLDLQEKIVDIIDNGQYIYTPDVGKYGLSKITVNVNNGAVPPTNSKLKILEYDENGMPKRVLVRGVASLGTMFSGNMWNELTEITIGEGVTTLSSNFINGTKITELHIPEGVTKLENNCFFSHPRMSKIYMPSTLTSIASSLSYSSKGVVTDIYCAFEDGKFTNAPWGYVNATIHYNYIP